MKSGFKIVYHKSIEKTPELEQFLKKKKDQFCSANSYKCRADSGAFYRRGLFGYGITGKFSPFASDGDPIIFTFKRLSKGRRIFGLAPIKELVPKKPPLRLNQCMCGIHRGGQRVNLATPYKDEDYIVFFETGEIKG